MTNISWFHDWSSTAGISIHSDSKSSLYWSSFRITGDGTNAYIEVSSFKPTFPEKYIKSVEALAPQQLCN